jgi:hypothetical protein
MLPKKNSIIVTVDPDEKSSFNIGELTVISGKRYNTNFRERNPSLAYVLEGLGEIKKGAYIMTDYNHFGEDSPYLLTDDIYSIPNNESIFVIINNEGEVEKAVNGNLVVELLEVETAYETAEQYKKFHEDRGIVKKGSGKYKAGDFVLFLWKANMEMSYIWAGIEKRFVRIHSDDIVGVVK